MARNIYADLSDAQLVDFTAQAVTAYNAAAGPPNLFGLTPAQITALQTAGTALQTAITNAAASEAAFHSDIQAKAAARQTVLNNIGLCAGIMYATPTATPELIAGAGFQPRDTTATPILPQEPSTLTATPFSNGTVKLRWERNGNPYGVEFFIEVSNDGVVWSLHSATKKKSITLNGFAPGVPKWFRVTATNRSVFSIPSQSAGIYGGEQQVQLQLAA